MSSRIASDYSILIVLVRSADPSRYFNQTAAAAHYWFMSLLSFVLPFYLSCSDCSRVLVIITSFRLVSDYLKLLYPIRWSRPGSFWLLLDCFFLSYQGCEMTRPITYYVSTRSCRMITADSGFSCPIRFTSFPVDPDHCLAYGLLLNSSVRVDYHHCQLGFGSALPVLEGTLSFLVLHILLSGFVRVLVISGMSPQYLSPQCLDILFRNSYSDHQGLTWAISSITRSGLSQYPSIWSLHDQLSCQSIPVWDYFGTFRTLSA